MSLRRERRLRSIPSRSRDGLALSKPLVALLYRRGVGARNFATSIAGARLCDSCDIHFVMLERTSFIISLLLYIPLDGRS